MMSAKVWRTCGMALSVAVVVLGVTGMGMGLRAAEPPAGVSPLVGRWDLQVSGAQGAFPSWFQVEKSGHTTLVGSYVGQFGSARPVAEVVVHGQSFRFSVPPQWERREGQQVFEGTFTADELRGETTDEQGRKLTFVGHRAPPLHGHHDVKWGKPVELFNGRDVAGWVPMMPNVKNGWVVEQGVLINKTPGNNIKTEQKFTDFQLHVEFRVPAGSNSGVYLRGRYEVQIEDNHGEEPNSHKIGGVYGFLTPAVNAGKPAGEWQAYDITLVGRVVTVILNGERIIDRQTIPGITGGAIDSDEGAPGPIYLQGDHGPVEFRKITITPALNAQ